MAAAAEPVRPGAAEIALPRVSGRRGLGRHPGALGGPGAQGYPIDIYIHNDRNYPISTEISSVVVYGLQELVNLKMTLVIKLHLLTIYCHSLIFSIDIW